MTTQTALVALVPEADPIVDRHRRELDSGRRVGVPAHVTILYPFMPPALITDEVESELERLLSRHPAFDVEFGAVAWFDDAVGYLRPTPDEPLRRLTADVWARWTDHPPYGGEIADPTPHLTIGDCGRSDALEAAVAAIEPALPIRTHVREVHLMAGSDQPASWTVRRAFELGAPAVP